LNYNLLVRLIFYIMKTPNVKQDKQLDLIFEVARILTASLDLEPTLEAILELLHKLMQLKRGAIVLLNPETETLSIRVAHGISPEAVSRGQYKIGEGITGKVVETGQAEIVPLIHEDPRFLDRTRSRGDISKKKMSFFCVPIKIDDRTVGALSVDKGYDDQVTFDADLRLLNIIAAIISQAVRHHQMLLQDREKIENENIRLRQKLRTRYQFENIIGHSSEMRQVFAMIQQVARSRATVLIRGESGTGKELVANAIHYNSTLSNGPFIKVNCAALPETVLESELFGHEKGAFTGALKTKAGRFEWADGGSIFLDEISEIPPSIQAKLLRVIQTHEFERVGGHKTLKVNVRIIAATNKNLEQEIKRGIFREDLYYRINVFPIFMPPLRERKSDIMLLADFFLEKYARENVKDISRISTPAIDMLMSYHWPGNIRELENCIERAVLVCDDRVIRSKDLPPSLQMAESSNTSCKLSLPNAVENLEREMIIEALKSNSGHQGKAAAGLGITERMMGYKIRKFHIKPKAYSARVKKYTIS